MSGCFLISTAWAGVNKKDVFVELTSKIDGNLFKHPVELWHGGLGIGYKKNNFSKKKYIGYYQTDFNLGSDFKSVLGFLNFEYGYELRRKRSFSYGANVYPAVPAAGYNFRDDNSLVLTVTGSLGVFGNIKIKDSFLISIQAQLDVLYFHTYIIHPGGKVIPPSLLSPSFIIKGKYFF